MARAKKSRQTLALEAAQEQREQRDMETDDETPVARDRARDKMVELLQNIGFSEGASEALADNQLLNRHEVLDQMDDANVTDICKAVRKPSGGEDRHPIPEMAVQRLQLLVFYHKHLKRIQMKFEHELATVTNISNLKDQKALEQEWTKQNPEHKLKPMQLDMQRAAQAFDQATTNLRRI